VIRDRLRRLFVGKTERRLALVILITTMVPLGAALYIGTKMFEHASNVWFNPEIGDQLDRGVVVYQQYVKAVKDDLDHQTQAIAASPVLRESARKRNIETLESELDALFPHFPGLLSLSVDDADGQVLAKREGTKHVDPEKERARSVRRALSDDPDAPIVVATFAVAAKSEAELAQTADVVKRYHDLAASRSQLYDSYLNAFAALLGITLLLTVPLGIFLARGVTRRINRLGAAINLVAQGDLTVRVPVTGSDELTDLARTFNRMIAEMANSRARIEFLQRIGAWQDMAQRLAHEIKNPLTPIQLAVQEVHKKYGGDDPRYRALLDTTLEIVEEEVGTLRRLVGNFSNFARLPHAELKEANLSDFLEDCKNQLGHLEDPSLGEGSADNEPIPALNVDIKWEVPRADIPIAIDRQMLRRVVVNLVRNAVQAIRDARASGAPSGDGDDETLGHVVVSAHRDGEGARIEVEDDGPGIAASMRGRIFDPYFTTKADGTGLGLAIVKKIVVEHGGEIEADRSTRLGGARFVLHLPGSSKVLTIADEAKAARERAKRQGVETASSHPSVDP
jgi:nitrogen fixation/metabolism regulation signal transduction histidine kinase